jgi:hypothetical protein
MQGTAEQNELILVLRSMDAKEESRRPSAERRETMWCWGAPSTVESPSRNLSPTGPLPVANLHFSAIRSHEERNEID